MSKRLNAEEATSRLALSALDLRAHFEAQLRTLIHVEQCLVKCRGTDEADTFAAAATALRQDMQVVLDNHRSIASVLDQAIADVRRLTFSR